MARLVAENIFSIDNKFWLRVATRNDTASSSEEKERLKSMADSVMILVQVGISKCISQPLRLALAGPLGVDSQYVEGLAR
jgi:hypothetical protein